jgi:hypothetical protein
MTARCILALVVALAVVAAAAPARAQAPDPTARRLYAAGLEAYDAGRYDVAIRAFEAASARAPADLLVFDLAQAHRKKFVAEGDAASLDRAIVLYRKFLASRAAGRERSVAGDALTELLVIAARRGADVASPPGSARAEAPPAAPAQTEIMIVSDARNAAVALDDGASSPAPLLETVEPGEHRAHVSAPGYADAELHVTAVAGRFVVSEARLQALPGAIALSGRRGAQVQIDAQPAGVLPMPPVSLAAGPHRVTLALRGYEPWGNDVNVDRGASLTLRVQQAPTRQRRAVRWVGVAASIFGAAAIGSCAVWSSADSEAARLYGQGQHTIADVHAYDAARSQRDAAMAATSVLLGVGGALAVTTVAIYLFDRR